LIFDKIRAFATLYINGGSSYLLRASTLSDAYRFAHPEIDYCNAELFEPTSFNFSSNFSQTLGTAKNTVGLAQ
jgi:hypothetical protein